jgi:hypothetical protein
VDKSERGHDFTLATCLPSVGGRYQVRAHLGGGGEIQRSVARW